MPPPLPQAADGGVGWQQSRRVTWQQPPSCALASSPSAALSRAASEQGRAKTVLKALTASPALVGQGGQGLHLGWGWARTPTPPASLSGQLGETTPPSLPCEVAALSGLSGLGASPGPQPHSGTSPAHVGPRSMGPVRCWGLPRASMPLPPAHSIPWDLHGCVDQGGSRLEPMVSAELSGAPPLGPWVEAARALLPSLG